MTAKSIDQQQITVALNGVYGAEREFLPVLRAHFEQAGDSRLKGLLETHLEETEQQIRRLEEIFGLLGLAPGAGDSSAATSIAREGDNLLRQAATPHDRDRAIAESALMAERFEVESYRPLVAAIEQSGSAEIKHLLHINLEQEEQTAHLLGQHLDRLSEPV
jgi:ferritin-like metal-binding protein YciE